MKSTFRILFYLKRQRAKTNGRMPLMARVTINGEQVQFSLKTDVDPDMWSKEFGRAKGNSSEAVRINILLDEISSNLRDLYDGYLKKNIAVTPSILKDAYFGLSNKIPTFMQAFHNLVESQRALLGIKIEQKAFYKYTSTYCKMQDYMMITYKRKDIALEEINHDFIRGFETYLYNHNHIPAGARKPMQIFKRVIVNAFNNGHMDKNPFHNYTLPVAESKREYLSMEQLNAIISKDITNRSLSRIRDIFVFQCFTGLSHIDVYNLKKRHIMTDSNGMKWIKSEREKTGVEINVPLFEIPLSIIEKYRDFHSERFLPVISNIKMNEALKNIAIICDLDMKLTTHVARHTFATTVTLENGVSLKTVSKMLAHKSIKTTEIYAKITTNKIREDMQILAGKLESKVTNCYA